MKQTVLCGVFDPKRVTQEMTDQWKLRGWTQKQGKDGFTYVYGEREPADGFAIDQRNTEQ